MTLLTDNDHSCTEAALYYPVELTDFKHYLTLRNGAPVFNASQVHL